MSENLELKLTKLIYNIDTLLIKYCNSYDSIDVLNSLYKNLSNQSIFKKWLQSLNITDLPPSTNSLIGNASTTDTNTSLISIDHQCSSSLEVISKFDSIQNDILQQNIDMDIGLQQTYSSKLNMELKVAIESEVTSTEDVKSLEFNTYHTTNNIQNNHIVNNIENQNQEQTIINNNDIKIPAIKYEIKLEHADNNDNNDNNHLTNNNSRSKRKQSGRRLSEISRQKKKKDSNLNNQVDDEWNAMYLQLILYHSSHNTYEVPLEYNVEDDQGNMLSLGVWYCDQKISYQEYQHDEYTKHWYEMLKDIMENNPSHSCNITTATNKDTAANTSTNSNTNNSTTGNNTIDYPTSHMINKNIQIKSEITSISSDITNHIDNHISNHTSNNNNNTDQSNKHVNIQIKSELLLNDNKINNSNNNHENILLNKIPSFIAYVKELESYKDKVILKLGYIKENITNSKLFIVYELYPVDYHIPYTTLYSINDSKIVEVHNHSVLIHNIIFEETDINNHINNSNNNTTNNIISTNNKNNDNINNNILKLNYNYLKLTKKSIDTISKYVKSYEPMMIF